jgi:hypothetical protein
MLVAIQVGASSFTHTFRVQIGLWILQYTVNQDLYSVYNPNLLVNTVVEIALK